MYARRLKRLFDLTLSGVGLILLALPAAGVALLILAVMGRPAFFTQRRIGKDGRPFRLIKFRTMLNRAHDANTITKAGDPRVTGLGRLLRGSKVDELPQLWNVFIGDMSFVGPRPDVEEYAEKLKGDQRRILRVRPGITGPATLAFRNEEKLLAAADDPVVYNDEVIFPQKIRLNMDYIDNIAFLTDLRYILRTLFGG